MQQDTPTEKVALNADVVAYSRLLADDFEATTATMEEYRKLVSKEVEESGGTLVNFVGDNFMAVFDDARDAVRTSIAIATEVESRNRNLPGARRAKFRMGLDKGEVVVSDNQYFGDVLNIAARIQAIARPGGVSISGPVYRALDEPALRFHPIGRTGLKNIPEEVEVFEFADLPGDGSTGTGRGSLSLESPTVAVLPIHTEMVDEQVAATAAVLRSDLIHRLTTVPQLNVVDANTEPNGRGAHGAARYMIESGVHQAGDQVRVYATLFDVSTMNIVKSHKWTVPVDRLFELSDEMATELAHSVEIDLIVGAPSGLYADLGDPEAIEKVYLGWYHLSSATPEGWSRAMKLFSEVAESHPDQPYGHVLSAYTNWAGASNGWAPDPNTALQRAREQARTAFEIGDPTGMAQTVEAAVLMSQGRSEEALAVMESVQIIRPTCDVTYGLAGSVRRYLGQWEKAVDLADNAMRLTGVNKPWYPTIKACSLFMGGKPEQAATVAEMVLEHQPHNLEALLVLAGAQVELGLDRRAHATAELVEQRFPSLDVDEWFQRHPYQNQEMVEQWKENLAVAGVLTTA